MSKDPREILNKEYTKRLNTVGLWPLKFAGYLRYEIKDSHFIKKLPSTIIRSVILTILVNISAAYVLFVLDYQKKHLSITETITVVCVTLIQNATQINVTFPNRNSGLELLNTCIEIDVILGYKETKFMRDIAALTFVGLSIFISLFQVAVLVVLYMAHEVSTSIHVVGSFFLFMAFSIFYDACVLVAFYNFLSLRVQYLNIGMMKLAKVNQEYFANQLFFNGILWRKSFDNLVTFHKRAEATQFIQVFGIIFKQLRQLEKCFRFTVSLQYTYLNFNDCTMCEILNSLISFTGMTSHKTIENHKIRIHMCSFYTLFSSQNITIMRTIAVVGWVGLGWIYLLTLSQHIDIYYRQIEKTTLICNYIQLKPIMASKSLFMEVIHVLLLHEPHTDSTDIRIFLSAKVLKLTKGVLRMLEVHEPRVSIYNMYYFNTSLMLQIAGSIFVYITVQLQLTVPTNRPSEVIANITDDSHRNIFVFR
ncbi:uncharacterized protein [Epargyreus clarus]|uniref:uncharacterized protein n=1 Tax=Epargyreus clarus TaxID=520877 RepID=UPI003C2B2496